MAELGAHINAVGATYPNWRELDDEILRRARLPSNRWKQRARIGRRHAAGNIFAGSASLAGTKAGRQSQDEITFTNRSGSRRMRRRRVWFIAEAAE